MAASYLCCMKTGFATSLLLFIFSACQVASSPADMARHFVRAMQQDKFTEAKRYATDDSKVLIDALALPAGQHLFPVQPGQQFTVSDIQFDKQQAYVLVHVQNNKQFRLLMKKEFERWKVVYDINTLMKTASE